MPDDRQYEFVYVLAPTAANAEVETLRRELAEHIGKLGGTVESTDLWGAASSRTRSATSGRASTSFSSFAGRGPW